MPFAPASNASVIAFMAIVVAVLAAFLVAVRYVFHPDAAAVRKVTGGLIVYLAAMSAVVGTGVLESLPLHGLPFFFGTVFVVSVAAGVSSIGGRMAAALPLAALVAFQAFRLPLELVLHAWVSQGTIPDTMTWSGQNWDIVSGIVAIAAAPFASRRPAVAWLANTIGATLLLNVMRVAILSSPVPFGWGVTPPLVLALHLPYALVGPVCVGGALFGHIVLTRALLRRPATGNA